LEKKPMNAFGPGQLASGRFAIILAIVLATLNGPVPRANAQYPDVEQPSGTAPPTVAAPAPPLMSPPEPSATAPASVSAVELTDEEKAEREGRRACKAAICAAFHNRREGQDISCKILKSFRKEQLDKIVSKAKISWPWGKVVCRSDIKLRRADLGRALVDDKADLSLDPHEVACVVARDKDGDAEIKVALTPKVSFEKGKAVKAQINWGKIEAPTLVKGAMWPATATDNTFNVLGGMLVEDINNFVGDKCNEVKSDWEGK